MNSATLLGVFIGGDAPTPDKKMLYFTEAEARIWARAIAEKAITDNRHIVWTDHPRTGKFDPSTGEERPRELRVVTDAIAEEFQKAGVSYSFFPWDKKQPLQLYDAKTLQKTILPVIGEGVTPPDSYQAMLHLLSGNPQNVTLVTADSTSMVTEINECVRGGFGIVGIGSANPVHRAQMQAEYQRGGTDTWTLSTDGHVIITTSALARKPPQPAHETIAQAIENTLGAFRQDERGNALPKLAAEGNESDLRR